jgi:hypothetical protein
MIQRIIFLACDVDICDTGESPQALTETEARRLARAAGWSVGANRDQPDYCPTHKEAARELSR